jgi:hypothetical protein
VFAGKLYFSINAACPRANCTAEIQYIDRQIHLGKEAKGTAKQRKSTRRVAWELKATGLANADPGSSTEPACCRCGDSPFFVIAGFPSARHASWHGFAFP